LLLADHINLICRGVIHVFAQMNVGQLKISNHAERNKLHGFTGLELPQIVLSAVRTIKIKLLKKN
jgi:hypothetical protein